MRTVVLHPGTPIKIAILAMGGQGGGVLADWLVEMAEEAGWWAQTTSVPGVAQRTGATVYYVELLPGETVQAAGVPPVLAMMPTPGDVDLVVAAELMEAGRAMQRGLVTPERTTLITSSHRSYAVTEKAALGNGIADSNKVIEAGRETARRMLCFDLQEMAERAGSVISASLFGAIAGSGSLPFERAVFEATVRRSGKGVEASLRAFALGFEAAQQAPAVPPVVDNRQPAPAVPDRAADPQIDALLQRVRADFPPSVQGMLVAGLRRLIDFQDVAYARDYLDRMEQVYEWDELHASKGESETHAWTLTQAMAQRLAVAMSYDDVIRVADLKTRGSRFERVRTEVGAQAGQLVYTTEYMHPRLEEICGLLPPGAGRRLEQSASLGGWIRRRLEKGRRVQTGTLRWFLMLYMLAGLRRFRRTTLRHQIESESIQHWFDRIAQMVSSDYALAVEVAQCRRLVKGYSGTHARSSDRFAVLMEAADQLHDSGQPDAAIQLQYLREAAQADEEGKMLETQMGVMMRQMETGEADYATG